MKSLYIIFGEEDVLRLEALDTIRTQAKQQGFLSREVFNVDSHFHWDELWYALKSTSLFSQKKLVEIYLPSGKPGNVGSEQLQILAGTIDQLSETVIIIVLPKLDKSQLASKWFKKLSAAGQLHEAKKVYPSQLPAWILARFAKHNLQIEQDALLVFAKLVEGNLLAAKQEIEIMALLHTSGDTIGLKEVETTCANAARFDIFQISDAWMAGDINQLLRILKELELNELDPVLIVWLLSEDIRTLIRLSGAVKQGQSILSVNNTLRLWGKKQHSAQQAIRRLSTRKLVNALQACAGIDRQIKGVESGNFWHSIKNLLIDLAS